MPTLLEASKKALEGLEVSRDLGYQSILCIPAIWGLRDAIKEHSSEIERMTIGWNAANVDVLHHAMTIEAQRKVLQQALDVLEKLRHIEGASWEYGSLAISGKAIKAIKGQLS